LRLKAARLAEAMVLRAASKPSPLLQGVVGCAETLKIRKKKKAHYQ